MLDKRTVKANLLEKESKNAKRMVKDLIQVRYKKIAKKLAKGEKVLTDVLTAEEEKLYTKITPLTEAHKNFAKNILRGHMLKVDIEQKRKRAVLRFLKDTPSIIGTDMKTYGPFTVDDVASLPVENAKIMVKQGLAEKVEVN
jgi:DNA replication factor GINS